MSRRRAGFVVQPAVNRICCFCGLSEDNELDYGKIHEHDGIVTHYYCLLLSSNMEQKGNDNEGILGFLTTDIQKELRRGKRLVCSYCKKNGATLGCCNTKCKRIFHFPCGLRAGSLHQFFGEFRSYCLNHRPKQKIDERVLREVEASGGTTCYICYEDVSPNDNVGTLWAPCCRKNAWFHRKCVQQLASSAGYFFKCPLCNNKKEFQKAMLDYGIFIPNQDASWELVPNAFQELLHRHDQCDAEKCLCPKGRMHTSVNAWELILCRLCGSQGVHMACGHLKWANPVWECSECLRMLNKPSDASSSTVNTEQRMISDDYPSDQESSNDSDISVGGRTPPPVFEPKTPLSPLPVARLRPGPRSFKLQQAETVVKSVAAKKKDTPSTQLEQTSTSSLPSGMQTECSVPSGDNVKSSSMETSSPPGKSSSSTTNMDQTSPDVIMIDSDDDIVEIIDENPKHNVLTTKDGTKIEIHNLRPAESNAWNVEGDVNVTECNAFEPQSLAFTQTRSVQTNTVDSNLNPHTTVQPIARTLQDFFQPDQTSVCSGEMLTSGVDNMSIISHQASNNTQPQNNEMPHLVMMDPNPSDSLMNIKITNVTSLPPEMFADVPETPSSVENNSIYTPNPPDFEYANVDELPATEATSPSIKTSEPRTTMFQLSTAAIKDISTKRKNDVTYMIDKNVFSSPNKQVVEQCKRARIGDTAVSTVTTPSSIGKMSWNLTVPGVTQSIPFIVTSMPASSYGGNGNQATKKMVQSKIGTVKATNTVNNRLEPIASIQESSSFYQHGVRSIQAISIQNRTTKNPNQINLPNNKIYPVGTQNTIDRTQSDQQLPANCSVPRLPNGFTELSRHFGGRVYLRMPVNTSTQQGTVCATRQPQVSGCVTNNTDNITTQTTAGGLFYTTVPGGYVAVPTGNKIQTNTVPQMSNVRLQQDSGHPVASGCDGDAGSSPAAGSGNDGSTVPMCPDDATADTVSSHHHRFDAVMDPTAGETTGYETPIVASSTPTKHHTQSTQSHRNPRDRSRMIPERVCLRDLKFHVSDSNILQMVVADTFTVNIAMHGPNDRSVQGMTHTKKSTYIKSSRFKKKKQQSYFTRSSKTSAPEPDSTFDNQCDNSEAVQSALSNTGCSNELEVIPSENESFGDWVIPDDNPEKEVIIQEKDHSEANICDTYCDTLPRFAFYGGEDKNSQPVDEYAERSTTSDCFEEISVDPLQDNVDALHSQDLEDSSIVSDERQNGTEQEKERSLQQEIVSPDEKRNAIDEDTKENFDPTVQALLSGKYLRFDRFEARAKASPFHVYSDNSQCPNDDSDGVALAPLDKVSIVDSRELKKGNNFLFNIPDDSLIRNSDGSVRPFRVNQINKPVDEAFDDSNSNDRMKFFGHDENISMVNSLTAGTASVDDFKFSSKVIGDANVGNCIEHWDSVFKPKMEDVNIDCYSKRNSVCNAGTLETFEDAVNKLETKTCINEKLYKSEMKPGVCVKVSIDLKKIQSLVHSKPHLFSKYNDTKIDTMYGKYDFKSLYGVKSDCKTEIKPILVKSQSLDDLRYGYSNNCLHSQEKYITRSMNNVSDNTNNCSRLKQRLKISSKDLSNDFEKYRQDAHTANIQKIDNSLFRRKRNPRQDQKRKYKRLKSMNDQ